MRQNEAVSLFDRLAAEYDSWYQTPLGALADALEQQAVFTLAGEVTGRITLDASCGTGNYALALARRGARVTAVDASAPMLALAQEKARRAGLRIRPVQASLERLPFRAGSFELATCILALEFVGNPADWPPPPDRIAARFDLPVEAIAPHLNYVFYLDPAQQTLVLSQVQRIADILAHIVTEQAALIGKLTTIANLITR